MDIGFFLRGFENGTCFLVLVTCVSVSVTGPSCTIMIFITPIASARQRLPTHLVMPPSLPGLRTTLFHSLLCPTPKAPVLSLFHTS
eukprot:1141559-Prymnesium_polylepis.1